MQGEPNKSRENGIFYDYMDVVDAIKKTPNGSACRPEGVPACLLKRESTSVALMLSKFLRHSFETGVIPDILN